jgi:hypothetical protein
VGGEACERGGGSLHARAPRAREGGRPRPQTLVQYLIVLQRVGGLRAAAAFCGPLSELVSRPWRASDATAQHRLFWHVPSAPWHVCTICSLTGSAAAPWCASPLRLGQLCGGGRAGPAAARRAQGQSCCRSAAPCIIQPHRVPVQQRGSRAGQGGGGRGELHYCNSWSVGPCVWVGVGVDMAAQSPACHGGLLGSQADSAGMGWVTGGRRQGASWERFAH